MRLLFLIAVLSSLGIANAQENWFVNQQITLDMKPNFEFELKRQAKTAENRGGHTINYAAEQKLIDYIERNAERKKTSLLIGRTNKVLNEASTNQ